MILLNVSSHCMAVLARLPSSLNGTPWRLLQKDQSAFQSLTVQVKRNFSMNKRFKQVSQQESKQAHLAVSRPRLYKQLQAEKAKDNVPKDWDLILSQGRHRLKLKVANWASFLGLCVMPVCLGFGLWQNQEEEDVVVLGVTISKNTEFTLFIAFNVIILVVLYRIVRNMPIRMYFNQCEEKYIAIMPAWLPWQTRRFEFTAMDVKKVMSVKTPVMLKPWKHNEFQVLNKLMILPQMCFHNGHDRHHLLRFIDLPDNMRKPM